MNKISNTAFDLTILMLLIEIAWAISFDEPLLPEAPEFWLFLCYMGIISLFKNFTEEE